MTTDPALSYHPTESLVLPTKRRFFPFRIPNYHQQLRHYISTADRDRIYVVVDRVIYSIHVSTRKRETIAVFSFEPKCLAAGHGWISVGGTENGECAFVKLPDRNTQLARGILAAQTADVDSALPIDLEPSQRNSPRTTAGTGQTSPGSRSHQLPDVKMHKFGGSIINSVTIHRLPGDEQGFIDEDVAVLSNNDKSVTLFSMTRWKVLQKIVHPACMNFAIISPDSSLLAAVGDEASAYFYRLRRDLSTVDSTENGEKTSGWTMDRILCYEMEIGPRLEDKCCFTIAFSQSNRLCAIGSQSGVISVFEVPSIHDHASAPSVASPIVCYFNSSRACCSGGAVRCMSFSPEPWDLLVWLEDRGRAGIADVRQAFLRRQILQLDMNEPTIEEVDTQPIVDESTRLGFDLDLRFPPEPRHDLDTRALDARAVLEPVENYLGELSGEGSDPSPLRESLMQDLSQRERLIVDFLNTARWTSRVEEGERQTRGNANPHTHSGSRTRHHGATTGANRAPRPTSPRPVILSQSNHEAGSRTADPDTSAADAQPSITLSWTASPAELQTTLDNPTHAADSSSSDQSGSSNDSANPSRPRGTVNRPSANFDYSSNLSHNRPRNHQRSRSVHRRPERQDHGLEVPHSLRSNIVAIERLRRQRQLINDTEAIFRGPPSTREQRYMQQPSFGFDHNRSPRWRSVVNDLPERSYGFGRPDPDPTSSAGLGFGADGRTLYLATVMGIFEYQINVMDRKTFPVITYR